MNHVMKDGVVQQCQSLICHHNEDDNHRGPWIHDHVVKLEKPGNHVVVFLEIRLQNLLNLRKQSVLSCGRFRFGPEPDAYA